MKAICNKGHESYINSFNNETKEWLCPECGQLHMFLTGDGGYSKEEGKIIVKEGGVLTIGRASFEKV